MNQRRSDIELLRIISMAMVVMVHLDCAALGYPSGTGSISALSATDWWKLTVEAIVIIGVNCFTLISGYFGIKARLSGFVRLTAQCLVYSVGIYTALALTGLIPWSWGKWVESWMVYTHTDLWYVPAYLGLWLVSPWLNTATESMSRRQFGTALGAFILFNVWAGWLWGGTFNAYGYTMVQLIMMYLIGRYISLYMQPTAGCAVRRRRMALAVYLLCTAAIAITAVYIGPLKAFAYNSPIVIASSVAFFFMFTTMSIRSKSINRLAAGAFAVYLIHKNPYVWGGIIKPLCLRMWDECSLTGYTIFAIAMTVATYLACSAIDLGRQWLFRQFESLRRDKVKV